MTIDNILTLTPLIRKFREKFFIEPVIKYAWQYQYKNNHKIFYNPIPCKCALKHDCNDPSHPRQQLSNQDLIEHFSGKVIDLDGSKRGCLAVRANQNGRFKWFVVDSDNQRSTDTLNMKFTPILKQYGIDYIYEHSLEGKCHIWFMTDCSLEVLGDFTKQLFREANIDFNGRNRDLQLELFSCNKPNNLIRIPGGRHLKNGHINPVTFRGQLLEKSEDIIKAFIDAEQYPETWIRSQLKKIPLVKYDFFLNNKDGYEKKLVIEDRRLPFEHKIPDNLKPLVSNCQAINKLLDASITKKELNKRGGTVHNLGLYLANVLRRVDLESKDENQTCLNWFLKLLNRTRDRSAKSHNWIQKLSLIKEQKKPKTPYCTTWSDEFGLCGGCPFKKVKGFYTPNKLIKPNFNHIGYSPRKVGEVNLKTADEIRTTTFKEAKNRVYEYVTQGIKSNILLASPQGSGKSHLASQIAAELAKQGKKTLIAVPTAELALEHRERLRKLGVEPFLLLSYENTFKKDNGVSRYNLSFDCPNENLMKYQLDLGLTGLQVRKTFCTKCPYRSQCPYPDQYTNLLESDANVVIMQHAHFSTPAMHKIKQKGFNLLIIDEYFIDSLVEERKITEIEKGLLESKVDVIPWVKPLLDWYSGNTEGNKNIPMLEDELQDLKELFDSYQIPWNLPLDILHFNNGEKYDPLYGIFRFHELPEIPVKLFTDATPPKEMLQIVLGGSDIEIIGGDEILDYTKSNPNNQILQVLDFSSSKTSISSMEKRKYYAVIESIGRMLKIAYKGKQTLLITYAGEYEDLTKEFFRLNYPEVLPYLTIGHMEIGTNKYENYEVLFQIAGVHLNAKQYALFAFKLKSIENYYHRLKGEPLVENIYPENITETSRIEWNVEPLKRIEQGVEGIGLYTYEDSDFMAWEPKDPYYAYYHKLALAKRQQAMRLRFHEDGKTRTVFIFDSAIRSSMYISNSITLQEFFNPGES